MLGGMKLLGEASVSSALESILLFFQVVAWFVAAAFVVLPCLGVEGAWFTFPVELEHWVCYQAEGPGGTWSFETIEAQVSAPNDGSWIGSVVAAPFMALIAFVLGELRAVFRSLREGSPFVAANARRLRRIGLGILVFEALRVVVTATVVAPAIESLRIVVEGNRMRVDAWPDWTLLFLAFAVLVLAEVFRRGTKMQDEQALTV